MNIKVKLVGSGVEGDPYRAQIPTYVLRHANHTEGWAIIHIPEDVHGLSPTDLEKEEVQETSDGPFYPNLSQGAIDTIHKHWKEKYAGSTATHKLEKA